MAVPARPVSGASTATDWGQVAHDTAVAQDIQTGVVGLPFSAANTSAIVNVTFPRPFAAPPVVTCNALNDNNGPNVSLGTRTVTATVAGFQARSTTGGNLSVTVNVGWIAIGPRA